LRGAHDLLLLRVPDGRARAQGPAAVAPAAVIVERVTEASDELVEAFARLVPQLTTRTPPPGAAELGQVLSDPRTVQLVARDDGAAAGGGKPPLRPPRVRAPRHERVRLASGHRRFPLSFQSSTVSAHRSWSRQRPPTFR